MFVRTGTRRSWLSHLFSSLPCRVFPLLLIASATAALSTAKAAPANTASTSPSPAASPSYSPTRTKRVVPSFGYAASGATPTPSPTPSTPGLTQSVNYTELPRDRNLPIDVAPFKKTEGKTDWQEFFRNVHGSYGLSFMGPRIAGSGNETYNIYLPDVAPVQLSHTWQLGVQVNPNVQLGFSVNSIQNISDNIVGKTGVVRGRTFETYDPELYVNLPNLVQVPGFFVFTSAKMSFPLSQRSKDDGKISQVTLDQSWTYSKPESDWSFGASLSLQPIFFSDPWPSATAQFAAPTSRQTFYASVGHLISYRISPIINIQSTSTLDFSNKTPNPANSPTAKGPFGINSNLYDTSRLAIYLSPPISNSIFISLGGYMQFLLWNPTTETSILGLDFSISF